MKQAFFKPNKLAALRAYHSLDQEELARKTGLSRPTIQRLETGTSTRPTLETLQALADFFGVNISVFFTDEVLSLS